MQELINKEKAVELFAQRGHFFYPEQLKGIGEITVLYIGPDKYYTRCNTTQFCKRLIRAFFMQERLVRDFSYQTLGQRKLAPLALHQDFVLVPFAHPRFDNPAHRTAFACQSSILTYEFHLERPICTLILKDHHTFDISYSRHRLVRQLRHADHLRNKFVLRFYPVS
jgi:hypothetical protein